MRQIDEFHLPSDLTATSFQKLNKNIQANTVVTGQPALEQWDDVFENTNREKLKTRLGIINDQPVVLFAGGYDGDYPNSFRIFLKAAKLMPETLFVVTHHPKYSGGLEQRLITEETAENVQLMHKQDPSTSQLSTIAKAVVVHQSTIAQQALYKGKPVVYVADSSFTNFIVEMRLASRVYNPEELHQTLSEILRREHNAQPSLKALGIPDNASLLTIGRLENILKIQGEDQ